MRNLKLSINQYRNINGLKFKCWTSNPAEFEELKKECKEQGLKFRIIDNQFYKQVL